MIYKVPVYVEFKEKLTPDQVSDLGIVFRKEFYQILNTAYKTEYEKEISFERKKIKFKLLSLGQVEKAVTSSPRKSES
jgi:hypothetical protein